MIKDDEFQLHSDEERAGMQFVALLALVLFGFIVAALIYFLN